MTRRLTAHLTRWVLAAGLIAVLHVAQPLTNYSPPVHVYEGAAP